MPPPCVRCGSKRWHRDVGGLYACEQGHQYTVHEEGDDENVNLTSQRRRIVRHKGKARTTSETGYRPSHRSLSVILEELQFELRFQVIYLVEHRGAPQQLVNVVRDLWLLWLVEYNPHISDRTTSRAWTPASDGASITDGSFHSAPTSTDDEGGSLRHHSIPAMSRYKRDILQSQITLVFCRMGCRILGVPILMGDLLRWASDGSMPYFSLPRHLPVELKQHFRIETKSSKNIPSVSWLKRYQCRVINYMVHTHKVSLSDPLPPSIILRLLKELNLPAGIYPHYKAIRTLRERRPVTATAAELHAVGSFLLAIKAALHSSTYTPSELPESEFNDLRHLYPPSRPEIEASFLRADRLSWHDAAISWVPPKISAKGAFQVFDEHINDGSMVLKDVPLADLDRQESTYQHGPSNKKRSAFVMAPKQDAGTMRHYQHFQTDYIGDFPLSYGVYLELLANKFSLDRDDLHEEVTLLETYTINME
ncbi:hypothetical protein BASA50_010866 [Batrachochytrium salamandrivorans]|uniref:Rrn7/TAF1B N-terminal cyclin domain-containing protein n=1 Tax=Batrachochytrium salamandrivorans TaxID=1357716 RepID=A0ABQ8EXA9_9FUNG|nr:hypothetical protein BASA60_006750 [Batrachochytrium salamandrivorans]KAH6575508.1 hypothetical protein BASA62_001878 [Batrachochytrium salamandrivorans]KAH6588185.1 hypothetical protein BASA50_010866 [Batrachochytrium salamandrivorans]KAH6600478.1 hypothetical protein BASA61_002270 [Batrachochytrium salamandrivorans]KAJ1336537.1 hypothetical protein BSLG_007321 [Batrachochytrium salamandrivorans]